MVTVACVASVFRGWPRTLALDKKLESHSAISPDGSGGISVGGAAGSNVWLAKATGSLLIRTEASRGWRVDEESLDVWQPKTSPPSNTEGTMRRRECKTASAIPFSERGHPEP